MRKILRKAVGTILSIMIVTQIFQTNYAVAFAAENPAKNARNSVVKIISEYYYDGEPVCGGSGTGVCVGKEPFEYVITNKHVVEADMPYIALCMYSELSEEEKSEITDLEFYRQLDMNKVSALIVVFADGVPYVLSSRRGLIFSNADLALLHLDSTIPGRHAIAFGNTETLEVMDKVYSLGYPGIVDQKNDKAAYDDVLSSIDDITATDGIVSRKNVIMDGVTYIQHTADINHGNSGGPLIDEDGRLIGINTLGWGDNTSSVYFSIDIDEVTRFLKQNNVEWIVGGRNVDSSPATTPTPMSTYAPAEPLKREAFTGNVAYFTKVPFTSATASSELYASNITFIAEYAIDDTSSEGIKRPWIEGSSGDGTGESLKLSFGKKESLRLLSFDLGYARDKARYFKNSRPKSLLLKFSDGSKVECEFQDKMETQYVYFNRPVETDSVEIVIMSAYTKCTEDGLNYYQDRDTGIFLVKAYKD